MKKIPDKKNEIYHGFQANLKPAPIGKRLLAYCIDYGILGAISYVLFLIGIFGGLFSIISMKSLGQTLGLVSSILLYLFIIAFILSFMALYHGYFIYFEYKKGQTPGKKLMGLSVVTDDGSQITKSKVIIRELFRYIDSLIIPAVICMAVTDRRQRLGDLMAGVFVAYSKTQEADSDFLYVKQADYHYIFELVQPATNIDPDFMNQMLVIASKEFLKGFNDSHMQNPFFQTLEKQVRQYFKNPDHERLDGRSALLFFAEYCYQTDIKLTNKERG